MGQWFVDFLQNFPPQNPFILAYFIECLAYLDMGEKLEMTCVHVHIYPAFENWKSGVKMPLRWQTLLREKSYPKIGVPSVPFYPTVPFLPLPQLISQEIWNVLVFGLIIINIKTGFLYRKIWYPYPKNIYNMCFWYTYIRSLTNAKELMHNYTETLLTWSVGALRVLHVVQWK